MNLIPYMRSILINQNAITKRYLHASMVCNKTQAGRYRPKRNQLQYLTYEMAYPPHEIVAKKGWNSHNTSNVENGNRPSETAVEDMFIRNFITGTWHGLCASDIIIKRQHNMVRISFIVVRITKIHQIYFLTGYTEELLSFWLHCIVKIELVAIRSKNDLVYKVL